MKRQGQRRKDKRKRKLRPSASNERRIAAAQLTATTLDKIWKQNPKTNHPTITEESSIENHTNVNANMINSNNDTSTKAPSIHNEVTPPPVEANLDIDQDEFEEIEEIEDTYESGSDYEKDHILLYKVHSSKA